MTPKERAAMQQALEALEELHYSSGTVVAAKMYESATAALREALAGVNMSPTEQAEQGPVAWTTIKNGIPNAWMFNPEFVKNNKDVSVALYATTVEQKNMKPIAWGYFDADGSFMDALDRQHGAYQTPLYTHPVQQAEQEPVYVENVYKRDDKYFAWIGDDYVQIYAAPVRTKDLTDDEIRAIRFNWERNEFAIDFARAVIAKDREKNNG